MVKLETLNENMAWNYTPKSKILCFTKNYNQKFTRELKAIKNRICVE